MTTYFTSDLHFGHQNIINFAYRPFSSVEEMNRGLIERWNSVVTDDDYVWILGDLVMGKRDETLPLVAELKGTKYLIPGNHDYCWWGNVTSSDPEKNAKQSAKVREWMDKYREVGLTIMPSNLYAFLKPDLLVSLCHFPAIGNREGDDRYPEHIPPVSETYNIHGHTHAKHRLHDGNQIHIGVDAWDYTPVSTEQILELINGTN